MGVRERVQIPGKKNSLPQSGHLPIHVYRQKRTPWLCFCSPAVLGGCEGQAEERGVQLGGLQTAPPVQPANLSFTESRFSLPSKLLLLPLNVSTPGGLLFSFLARSPVFSAAIKTRMESISWLAPVIVPLPKGRGFRRGPSRNLTVWASTFSLLHSRLPPLWGCCCSWRLEGGHSSGFRAGTWSTMWARGRVLQSLLGEQCHPPVTGENGKKGKDGLGS